MICGPTEFLWIFAGLAVGGSAGILIIDWVLRRWIEKATRGKDGLQKSGCTDCGN